MKVSTKNKKFHTKLLQYNGQNNKILPKMRRKKLPKMKKFQAKCTVLKKHFPNVVQNVPTAKTNSKWNFDEDNEVGL